MSRPRAAASVRASWRARDPGRDRGDRGGADGGDRGGVEDRGRHAGFAVEQRDESLMRVEAAPGVAGDDAHRLERERRGAVAGPPVPACGGQRSDSRFLRVRPRPRGGRYRGDPPLQSAALRDGAAHGHRLRGSAAALFVGYKDHGPDEFWTRGHMPGMPLLPGVLMCEAAAQMCSYFTIKYDLLGTNMVGFGGMDEVRFRDPVRPGDRLVIVSEMLKLRRGAMVVSRFQGFVRQSLVVRRPDQRRAAAGRTSQRPAPPAKDPVGMGRRALRKLEAGVDLGPLAENLRRVARSLVVRSAVRPLGCRWKWSWAAARDCSWPRPRPPIPTPISSGWKSPASMPSLPRPGSPSGELANARIVHGDGLRVFRERLPAGSLAAVHVYFPDPWWKARHKAAA